VIIHPTNQFLSALNPSDLALLQARLRDVELTAGEYLHRANEAIAHVYFPRSGLVTLTVALESGVSVETALVGREGVIGAQAGFGIPFGLCDARVQVPGRALRISATEFHRAMERSASMRTLAFQHSALLLGQSQQSAACNAAHSVEARMCRWLLEIVDRADATRIPLTQQTLAQMLGVRRTTVTLIAGNLQSSGALKCRRGYVHVLNRAAIAEKACECYHAVRNLSGRVLGDHVVDPVPLQAEAIWAVPKSPELTHGSS
jgi:CRP-like cAMP-binding protein